MSMTHEDPLQQRGVGSGDNRVLVERVDRHRRNEASYRFHSRAELEEVEQERLRLEKDMREVRSDAGAQLVRRPYLLPTNQRSANLSLVHWLIGSFVIFVQSFIHSFIR